MRYTTTKLLLFRKKGKLIHFSKYIKRTSTKLKEYSMFQFYSSEIRNIPEKWHLCFTHNIKSVENLITFKIFIKSGMEHNVHLQFAKLTVSHMKYFVTTLFFDTITLLQIHNWFCLVEFLFSNFICKFARFFLIIDRK